MSINSTNGNQKGYDISVVLGSKNRKKLLQLTINSIRDNDFNGRIQMIVIDGGSTDGTCDWLAHQKDILTIIQPNYRIKDNEGIEILRHSWGTFMNIAFRYAEAKWIVMVSDDLILTKGALQNGYDYLEHQLLLGKKIGGGAFYFREYPRYSFYRIGLLQNNVILINHGFFNKDALIDVNYIDELNYNFYFADSDLCMRMHKHNWEILSLDNCYAEHLVHIPKFKRKKISPATLRDIKTYNSQYSIKPSFDCLIKSIKIDNNRRKFWFVAFTNCMLGMIMRWTIDRNRNPFRSEVAKM